MKRIKLIDNLIRCPICGSQCLKEKVDNLQTYSTIKTKTLQNNVEDRKSYYHKNRKGC